VVFIGGDDAGDQRVAYHVFLEKLGESQAAHALQEVAGFAQAFNLGPDSFREIAALDGTAGAP